MSGGIYIYTTEDDEVRAWRDPNLLGHELTVCVGDVCLYLHTSTAAALHAALGTVLAPPDPAEGA